MATGTIKNLNTERGFGFIRQDVAGEKDVFFHCTALEGVRMDELQEKQAVSFEIEQGEKGLRATHVKPKS